MAATPARPRAPLCPVAPGRDPVSSPAQPDPGTRPVPAARREGRGVGGRREGRSDGRAVNSTCVDSPAQQVTGAGPPAPPGNPYSPGQPARSLPSASEWPQEPPAASAKGHRHLRAHHSLFPARSPCPHRAGPPAPAPAARCRGSRAAGAGDRRASRSPRLLPRGSGRDPMLAPGPRRVRVSAGGTARGSPGARPAGSRRTAPRPRPCLQPPRQLRTPRARAGRGRAVGGASRLRAAGPRGLLDPAEAGLPARSCTPRGEAPESGWLSLGSNLPSNSSCYCRCCLIITTATTMPPRV